MTDTPTAQALDRARDAMNLQELQDRLRDLMLRRARIGETPADSTLLDAMARTLAATGDVSDEIGEQLLAARNERDIAALHAEVLRRAEGLVTTQLRERHRTHADAGLQVLADDLDVIVDVARPVFDDLGPVGDADAAIRARVVEPWQQASQLAERYQDLRDAQALLLSAALDPTPGPGPIRDEVSAKTRALLDAFGHVPDPEEWHSPVVAGYLAAHAATTGAPAGDRVNYLTGLPMRDENTRAPWLAAPLHALRFVSRRDVQPWVPTVAEIRNLRDRLVEQQRQQHDGHPTERDYAAEREQWDQTGRPDPGRLHGMARSRGLIGGANIGGMTFPTPPSAA